MKAKTIFVTCMAAAIALNAAVPTPSDAEPQLAGIVSIAPYADLSAKATSFGMLIGNPVVPALMLASIQQSVVATHGRFRSDLPAYVAAYMDKDGRNDMAVVYPSVDRIARMALAHPGSERQGKDTLHLLPTERNPHDRYAVFAEDNMFTAFASSAELARRALADCQPSAKESLPLLRLALRQPALKKKPSGALGLTPTNVTALLDGFVRLDLSLDLTERGLALAFSGVREAATPEPGLKKRLEGQLRSAFKGLCGDDEKLMPSVTVDTKPGGAVTGEVLISEEQLKGLGKDFNSFVSTQMSGALSTGKDAEDGKAKAKKKSKD